MSVMLLLALKLGLPAVLGAGGGHLLGGLIVAQATKYGIPATLAKQLLPLVAKYLPQLLQCLDTKKVEELPTEQRNEVRQIEALVNRNVRVFSFR